ncbi:unnamed protein product [Cuscuta campestris]|uniref:Uncharacterized protein n=1 Tax=Cuscuta campestris TaxID=132261 RepID=A0A484LPN9_9ASTE|nr:unnamed protein product [Cuscuta campestris]
MSFSYHTDDPQSPAMHPNRELLLLGMPPRPTRSYSPPPLDDDAILMISNGWCFAFAAVLSSSKMRYQHKPDFNTLSDGRP